jgi:hypothetical protein
LYNRRRLTARTLVKGKKFFGLSDMIIGLVVFLLALLFQVPRFWRALRPIFRRLRLCGMADIAISAFLGALVIRACCAPSQAAGAGTSDQDYEPKPAK